MEQFLDLHNIIVGLMDILTLGYILLMVYYLLGWFRQRYYRSNPIKELVKVSIIVPARNEAENLPRLIESYAKQVYASSYFELIVINDNSTDNTVEMLKAYQSKVDFDIHILDLPPKVDQQGFKKLGIEMGVNKASGELIITNDADCFLEKDYLSTIVSFYQETSAKMIIAPVQFTKGKSFIEHFQSIDFFSMIGIAAASSANNFPQVCNGANLIYTKEAFEQVNGFKDVNNVPSGDDMFLMQKINFKFPRSIRFLKSRDAIVTTYPMGTLKAFFHQRVRWASKNGQLIDKRVVAILGWMLAFNVYLLLFTIYSLLTGNALGELHSVWLIKFSFDFTLLYQVAKFFKQRNLLSLFIPSQICHLIYIIVVGSISHFVGYEWKGRAINKS